MKKILSLLLAVTVLFSLAACGKSKLSKVKDEDELYELIGDMESDEIEELLESLDEEEEETPNVSEDTKDAQKKSSVYVKRDGGTVYISSIEKDGYEFFGTGDFGRETETVRQAKKIVIEDDINMIQYSDATSSFFGGFSFSEIDGLEHLHLYPQWPEYKDLVGRRMFQGCKNLKSIDMSQLADCGIASFDSFFSGCSSLESVDFSGFDVSKIRSASSMFSGCDSLVSIDLSSLDFGNIKDMADMFWSCDNLVSVVMPSSTGNVDSMDSMFYQCKSLTDAVLPMDTYNVTDMSSMFFMCESLQTVDISTFSSESLLEAGGMFQSCDNLTTIYAAPDFDLTAIDGDPYFPSSLVGGCGTSASSIEYKELKNYARVDRPDAPGLFTEK